MWSIDEIIGTIHVKNATISYFNDEDKSKPISQRKFVDVLMHSDSVKDYLRVSEQFTGKPKQLIEMGDNAVTVNLVRGKND